MHAHISCPTCGEDGLDVVETEGEVVTCPRCGTRLAFAPVTTEDDVASWLGTAPARAEPPQSGEAGNCPACGYYGPMLADASLAYPDCPACGASQRDRATGRLVRMACPECCEPVEAERGKSVVCPHCKKFLGCLNPEEKKARWWRRLG